MTKYLHPDFISPASKALPLEPFIVRPADFYVIDGDTIAVNATKTDDQGKRLRSFSIRLRSVEAPERSKKKEDVSDIILGKMGRRQRSYDPGSFSHSTASILLKGRCILVVPGKDRQRDDHDRLLGDVYVSGSGGKKFNVTDAFSLERVLLEDLLVTPRGNEDLPPLRLPENLRVIREPASEKRFDRKPQAFSPAP